MSMSSDLYQVGEPGTRVHIPRPKPPREPILRPIVEAAPAWIAHQKHESHPVVFAAGVLGAAVVVLGTAMAALTLLPFIVGGLAVREYVKLHRSPR